MSKKELRKLYRTERGNISDKVVKDKKIAINLLESDDISNADTVLIYVSFGSEIDTLFIISELVSQGKTVAVPKCEKNGIMNFIKINSTEELVSGLYGILEPKGSEKVCITDKTVCVVPALAFTESGIRLGYGGGYYDRFLSVNDNIMTIGVSYGSLIVDTLPTEEFDINVKKIITEERTVQCSAKR